jgi:hypothetical protein
MTWRFLGVRLDPSAAERFVQNVAGAAEDVVQIVENDPLKAAAAIAIAVVLPQVVAAAGAEILAATEVVSGLDFVASVDAINSVTGLTGAAASGLVGQAAFTAASTGGDLSQTLQTVLTNATGVYVDSTITDAFDSKLAGGVVRAATLASLNDKDVGQAVGLQLIPASVGAAVGAITSRGASVGDYYDFPTDEFAFEYDKNLDIFADYVTLGDLGIFSDADAILANVDQEALNQFNIAVDAVVVSPEGDLYDVQGQTVGYTAKTYAASIYVDPTTGDVYGPDNIRRLTASEAAAAVAAGAAGCSASDKTSWGLVAGLGGVCLSPEQSIAQEIQRRMSAQSVAGQVVIPGAGVNGRLAGLPPPNPNGVKMPEAVGWAAAAEAITRSAANVWTVIQQVSRGTYRPGATSPYGTVRPPAVGVRVQQPDGSTVVNNGNGTQTITYPDGTRRTMSTSVLGSGLSGGSFFGGVSQNTLLIAGAAVAAVLLLRK